MAIPEVTIQVLDNALGIAPENIDGLHVKLGISSLGTPNTIYSFGRPQDVVETLGTGPLVEGLTHSLVVAGGPVYGMPITPGVPGTSTVPVNTGGGPAVTLTGAPRDQYDGTVKIISAGVLGTSTFQYTLDGGDNWSDPITTAATYEMPNTGVTLNFAAGAYIANATYTWTSTAPYFNTTNLNSAFTALLARPEEWDFAHVLGRGAAAADSVAMAAAIQTHMITAATNYRYVSTIFEVAEDTDANLISAFASVSADRVMGVAGSAEMFSQVDGRLYRRHWSVPVAARGAKVAGKATVGIATDIGRVKDGPIPLVTSLYRDERATPGLDAARLTTARTIIGKQGFYITQGRTLAPAGSDYWIWQNRRVIDKACRLTRAKLVEFLNDEVRTNANGTIYELDARAMEAEVRAVLDQHLVRTRNATRVSVAIDRSVNLTSTGRIVFEIRVRPLGYLKDIRATVGFEAPNLALAA